MKFPFFRGRSPQASAEERGVAVKSDPEDAEMLASVRQVLRRSNIQVSTPMDTAIIAGGQVGGNVKLIQEKTSNLHNQISDASSAIEQIAANVRQFSGVVERQNQALTQTGAAVDAMSSSVNSVAEVTRLKMNDAGHLQKIIDKGGEDVKSTARAIEEVNVGIAAVADVIKVINSIAAQTNLLAMNAAIEAAHAGEAGKGFAVVASEVRKLAESTTENSKAITESLKTIINQIQGAKQVGESAGASFSNIEKEVNNFVGAFSDISRASAGLSDESRRILDAVGALRQVAAEISGGSKEIAIGADNVDNALRGIKDFSTGLKDDMDFIKEKVCDISGAQSGIALYMVETNRTMENLFQRLEEKEELTKENDLFNYGLIVLMHRNWLIQLRAFLDDRKDQLKAGPEDHLKCDLGKWIYGDGKRFRSSQTFMTLEKEHQNFHAAAGMIIKTKTSGDRAKAEGLYQKLMENYNTVVGLLDKLKQERQEF